MEEARSNASDGEHPLHNLVQPGSKPGTYEWKTTTRVTESGKVQTGRYASGETGPIVQCGHEKSYAEGGPQTFTLEDADMNISSGQTIESKGGFSSKERVFVTKADGSKGVWVEAESLKQWERLGVVPKGTVERAVQTTRELAASSTAPKVRVGQTAQEYLADANRGAAASQSGQGPRIEVGMPADEPAAELSEPVKKAARIPMPKSGK